MENSTRKPWTRDDGTNMKRRFLPLALVLPCLFALALTAGCASQDTPAEYSDTPDASAEETAERQGEEATDSEAADAEPTTINEADTGAQSTYEFDVPTEEEAQQNDEWADAILRGALTALADEGVIAPFDYDALLLNDAFQYCMASEGYGIDFQDVAAGEELSGSYTLPEGKVIVGFGSCYSDITHVAYADGNWGDGDGPLFYPESLFGYLDQYQMSDAFSDVPVDTFANSLDECDYLVLFDGVDSHVDEDFYDDIFDRVAVTTLVVIVDVEQGKIVHIENVGTDMPGNFVDVSETSGNLLRDDLAAYLHDLLLDRPES